MTASDRLFHAIVVLGAAITTQHCGRTERDSRGSDRDASDDSSSGGTGGTSQTDATTGVDGSLDATPILDAELHDAGCVLSKYSQCDDGIDNDQDGKKDMKDPECGNPCESECGPVPDCSHLLDIPCGSCFGPCSAGFYCLGSCCSIVT